METSPTRTDIESRADIERLVNRFYEYIHQDEVMAPVFRLSPERWEFHLKRTYDFWDNWIFQTASYPGGLMWAHFEKNATHPFRREHFERWLGIWFGTVDELFAGPRAEFIKSKAYEIGNWMFGRIEAVNNQPQS
ncbi:group III truncated hemoglobin [Tellurirhabdus rosea]|uniref:group III truncated hemoglobin n=1 Tax=Tellurirhabdus rosea TaxID=2674997 RepID=UPI00225582C3|nr:group III truncated hemoglobin [Tellurirhabdus rosea]